jgi:hypothetical protein
MNKKLKFLLIIVGILIVLIVMGNLSDKNKGNPNEQNVSNTVKIGIGYFPLNPIYDSDTAWTKASQVADIAYIQRHWKEKSNPDGKDFFNTVKDDVRIAKSKGMEIYIALETLSPERELLELPSELKGDFSNEKVKQEYLDTVKLVAENYKPDYLILNVEVNLYKQHNPQDYENYKILYGEAYDLVKQVSPNTKTAVSLSYQDFNGKDCFDSEDTSTFSSFVKDFPKQDIFAVSTYPLCYGNPKNIPNDLFTRLNTLSKKPLFISETGYPSKSFFGINSNEKTQAEFVKKIKSLEGTEIVNYVSLIDPSEEVCDLIVKAFPNLAWYCSLSLIDEEGDEKQGFEGLI